MSGDPGGTNPKYGDLRTRLVSTIVPVTVLMIGYFASTWYFAGRERAATMAALPERPALSASTEALAPVLDEAIANVEADPNGANVGRLGMIYQANQFFEEAVACYARAMALEPRNAQWPYRLATVYDTLGQEEKQQQAQQVADSLGGFEASPDPLVDDLDPYCYHTEQLLALGIRAEKLEQWDRALSYFTRVRALDPDNFGATARMGDLLQKQGRMEESEPLLLKALTLPAPTEAHYSSLNMSLGNNYLSQGHYERSVTYYEAALALDPKLAAAHQGLAACYLKLDRPADAIAHCEQALALQPESHEAHYNWGQALMTMGRLDEALPHFAEAHRLNPGLPPADYKAGAYYFKQGDMEKAVPFLERALDAARYGGNQRLAQQIQTMLGG